MAKYVSGRQKNLVVGLSSYSENLTSLQIVGKVGIGTTNAGSSLSVVGNGKFTGVVTALSFSGDGSLLTGITATGSGVVIKDDGVLSGTATTIDFGTDLSVSLSSGTATINDSSTLNSVTGRGNSTTNGISVGVLTATSGIQGIGIYSGGNLITSGIITALNFVGTGNTFAVVGNRVDISIASGSGSGGAGAGAGAGGTTGQIQFNSGGISTGANYFNYDNTTARVGIGTSVPTARLSVASTTTGTSLLVVNDNLDRKSTRLNSSHVSESRMPSSA